jgi:hypothetical protein
MTHYEFSFSQLPNQLVDVIQDNGVELLDLSLTSGRWLNHDDHTIPSWLTNIPHPGMHLGIGLISSSNNSSNNDIIDDDTRYQKAVRGLSGLFCASLDSAIQGTTVSPAVNWFPGVGSSSSSSSIFMHTSSSSLFPRIKYYVAKAPEESVCTENIGAVLKLLPCSASQQGLASTIPPRDQLMASSSLVSIRIMINAMECGKVQLKLSLTVQWNRNMVNIESSPSATVIPSSLEPLELLKTLLMQSNNTDNKTIGYCPASSSTRLHYFSPTATHQDAAAIKAVLSSHPQQCTQPKQSNNPDVIQGHLTTCSLLLQTTTTTSTPLPPPTATTITSPFIITTTTTPPPKVTSHLSFNSIVLGTLTLTIQSSMHKGTHNGNDMIHIVQIVPWQTPPLLHTLRVSPPSPSPSSSSVAVAWQRSIPPNQATKSAGLIELLLLPPINTTATTIHISVAVQKKMLGVFDYPTDPSRGIHFPPATVTYIPSSCADKTTTTTTTPPPLYSYDSDDIDNACSSGLSQRHSLPIIVPVPIPDFSMYFNVICFTCMPIALLFGGVLNVLFSPPDKVVKVPGGEFEGFKDGSGNSGGPTVKERLKRLVAVGILVGGLAVYLDKDLQRKADHLLNMGKENYYHLMGTGDKEGRGANTEL